MFFISGKSQLPLRNAIFRAVAIYLTVNFIALAISTAVLTRSHSRSLQILHGSVLLYASSDHRSNDLASWARSSLHIQTINLIEPGTGKAIQGLVGMHKVISPTLVLRSAQGNRIASGSASVLEQLEPVTKHMSPFIRGKMALAIIPCLLCLAVILIVESLRGAAFLPIPGLLAIGEIGRAHV